MITTSGKIEFTAEGMRYNLSYERFYYSEQIERVRVFGKNSKIELQSDRPAMRKNNKKSMAKWQIISAVTNDVLSHPIFVNTLFVVLQNELDALEKGPAFKYNKKSW